MLLLQIFLKIPHVSGLSSNLSVNHAITQQLTQSLLKLRSGHTQSSSSTLLDNVENLHNLESITSFINRNNNNNNNNNKKDNMNNSNNNNNIRREPNLNFNNMGGCHSCQLLEQVKADNLASIKRHILLRLELKTLPNITSPIVPSEIIEKFYKNHSLFSYSSSNDNNNSYINKREYNNKNSKENDNRDSSSAYDNMQGDDPRSYNDYGDNIDSDPDDNEEEFFSVTNSIYVFPTTPRMRHNRKSDILHFSFINNGHSTVIQANLHIYLRGKDWMREFQPNIFSNYNNHHEIILTINRVLRRSNNSNTTHTQKVIEFHHQIPNGQGTWVDIDVTDMASSWQSNSATNHGVVIKTLEPWMKPFVVTDDGANNKAFALYIEVLTKDNRKRRTKRNTSLNCSESDNEERCCRYPLEVDFRKFNWDWIVAPHSFNAYFCNGECKLGFLPKYPHTHIMQLSTAPQPCCSPTKMSPISLLYFNNEHNLVMSTIPNMAVDKCSCS